MSRKYLKEGSEGLGPLAFRVDRKRPETPNIHLLTNENLMSILINDRHVGH